MRPRRGRRTARSRRASPRSRSARARRCARCSTRGTRGHRSPAATRGARPTGASRSRAPTSNSRSAGARAEGHRGGGGGGGVGGSGRGGARGPLSRLVEDGARAACPSTRPTRQKHGGARLATCPPSSSSVGVRGGGGRWSRCALLVSTPLLLCAPRYGDLVIPYSAAPRGRQVWVRSFGGSSVVLFLLLLWHQVCSHGRRDRGGPDAQPARVRQRATRCFFPRLLFRCLLPSIRKCRALESRSKKRRKSTCLTRRLTIRYLNLDGSGDRRADALTQYARSCALRAPLGVHDGYSLPPRAAVRPPH